MFYTVAAEFELQYAAHHASSHIQVFKSEGDAVCYLQGIRGVYTDNLIVYKLVPVSTYSGRAKNEEKKEEDKYDRANRECPDY
jgi:hypothetical protein